MDLILKKKRFSALYIRFVARYLTKIMNKKHVRLEVLNRNIRFSLEQQEYSVDYYLDIKLRQIESF